MSWAQRRAPGRCRRELEITMDVNGFSSMACHRFAETSQSSMPFSQSNSSIAHGIAEKHRKLRYYQIMSAGEGGGVDVRLMRAKEA
jgi:hypothetical protein